MTSSNYTSTHLLNKVILLKGESKILLFLPWNEWFKCFFCHLSYLSHTHRNTTCFMCHGEQGRTDSLKQSGEICWCLNLWMRRTDRNLSDDTHTSWQPIYTLQYIMLAFIPHRHLYRSHAHTDSFTHILYTPPQTHIYAFLTHTHLSFQLFVLPL